MQIKVEVRSVYGNTMVYPACADARRFAEIAGTKTLSHGVLCLIEALGYTIIQTSPSVTWSR